MECPSCILGIVALLLGYLVYHFTKHGGSKYPPGPTGIPFFGSFFSLGFAPHLTYTKWAKKYGPVFSVKLGGINAVVLNDAKSIREAFKEDAFAGRPMNKFFLQFTGGKQQGVVGSVGHAWTEQRRFALKGLRDFGVGKNTMESIITEEVDEFIEGLKKETGQPISLNRKFSLAILNSIWMITCGRRYKQDDPRLQKILDTGAQGLNENFKVGILIFFEWLADVFPEWSGFNKFLAGLRDIFSFIRAEIKEHRNTFVPENLPRDFVDTYLAHVNSTTDPKSSFYKENGYDQLEAVMLDFFTAGQETTATTLTWAVLYLATHPKVQKKLQEEIHRVIGKNRKPTLADKASLPYVEATMQEVFRMSSIVPMGVFHTTMANVSFRGFEIPKNTYVFSNIHGALRDPNVWKDPETFSP
jgi:cytochrome P450